MVVVEVVVVVVEVVVVVVGTCDWQAKPSKPSVHLHSHPPLPTLTADPPF